MIPRNSLFSLFLMGLFPAQAQITVDGSRDAAYGPPVAVQLAPTGFGDNMDPDPLIANGSELNAAYAVIRDGKLHLLLTGNLETNFNTLEIFIDSITGGQSVILPGNPDVDGAFPALDGLTFDSGFEADHYFTPTGGFPGGAPQLNFYPSYGRLKTATDPGVGIFLGETGAGNTTLPFELEEGVRLGIDNSNIDGVSVSDASGASDATTGIEWEIPLALIGNPTGPVRICAFINGGGHGFLSNQFLGSLAAATPNQGSNKDLSSLAGDQFFDVPWQVTSIADNGAGSLRQTIIDAPPGSTITFDPTLSGQTIALSSQITFGESLLIDASGLSAGLTLTGGGAHRHFLIPAGITVSIQGLTFENGEGQNGGSIRNFGTLTVRDCSFLNNGLGIDLSEAGQGGGIYSSGALTLEGCTFSGNSAFQGGAVRSVESSLSVVNCTFTNNSATIGGAFSVADGGPDAVFRHVTITGNDAVVSGTFGGGGLFVFGKTVKLQNCIIAGNTSPHGPDIQAESSTSIDSEGGNLVGKDSGFTWNLLNSSDQIGTESAPLDPLLAPLGDYGGPTLTMPPLPGSAAINSGLDTGGLPATDQRGFPRFVNSNPDSGAVEVQTALTVANANDSGAGSLRNAIAGAAVDATITFDGSLSGETITLTSGQLVIARNLEIDGSVLGERVTIDANGVETRHRVLEVAAGSVVTLDSLRLTGGNTPDGGSLSEISGGGVLNGGDLTLRRVEISGNTAGSGLDQSDGGDGGGVYSTGPLALEDCLVRDNTAGSGGDFSSDDPGDGGSGGGIYCNGTLSLENSTVTENHAGKGGSYNGSGSRSRNGVGGAGGGIYANGAVMLLNSAVTHNGAGDGGFSSASEGWSGGDGHGGSGGGIWSESGLILQRSEVSRNFAGNGGIAPEREAAGGFGGSGGGIYCRDNLTLVDSTVAENTTGSGNRNAGGGGGGISCTGNSIVLTNSTVSGNTTGTGGGVSPGGSGGGVGCGFLSVVTMVNSTISGNMASGGIGGIGVYASPFTCTNSIIAGNTAASDPNLFLSGEDFSAVNNSLISGEPKLAPLGNYGGSTRTMPPLEGSPAIDGGIDTGSLPLADQRGLPRVVGLAVDIGAVETGTGIADFTAPVVTSAGDGFDGLDTNGITLREACDLAAPGAIITFDPSLEGQTIILEGGPLRLARSLDIIAAGLSTSGVTISGNGKSRLLSVDEGVLVTLDSVSLIEGKAIESGGALINEGELTLRNVTIARSLSFENGGGLMNLPSGSLTLINTTIAENVAAEAGGGVFNAGSMSATHATVSDNLAFFGGGGGVFTGGSGSAALENSIVAGNLAANDPNLSGPAATLTGNNLLTGNPLLAPLGDYGGLVLTMPPLPGSPSIEGALLLDTTPDLDQLGNARPSGPLPDLGAVEAFGFGSLTLADADFDEIPDLIEPAYAQFSVGIDDSGLDSDGDGVSDADELGDMTNPLDPADYFRILSFTKAAGFTPETPVFDLTVKTFPGLSYRLERQQDLAAPFDPLADGSFIADEFSETFQIQLMPGRDFIRAVRE
ncbi:right-handed parallel beta-helix repeat-containing protein [Haloferula rosea]|uniref:Right-handed parallel beta-helix repeat-containing protein n=1 Tax=Haloferula rosea TaxID=490093 RepID=A0A934RCY0_9BACT|nr:right-handed parallel beta-helix repeat-containing protein [Haloferula rosea]MBK1827292.1 right-handed parallel beta-helix repeat-containing protein [Haloferula rosea]